MRLLADRRGSGRADLDRQLQRRYHICSQHLDWCGHQRGRKLLRRGHRRQPHRHRAVFPAVCTQLNAALTSVNDDLPTSVDATVTNPDGARIQAALNSLLGELSRFSPGQAVELSVDGAGHNAFLTGPLSMPSNVTLLVDPGVYVYFSRNAQDYDKVAGTHTCGTVNSSSATGSCLPLIDIPGTSTNVGIMGFGKLDGRGGDVLINAISPYQGQSWWGLSAIANSGGNQQNPRFIQIDTGASNITLYKITLRNSPLFHISTTRRGLNFHHLGYQDHYAHQFAQHRRHRSRQRDRTSPLPVPGSRMATTTSLSARHNGSRGEHLRHQQSLLRRTWRVHRQLHQCGCEQHSLRQQYVVRQRSRRRWKFCQQHGTFTGGVADSNSTGLRIKSGYDRGGVVTNIQYSNSCYQDHKAEIVFSPNYEATTGLKRPIEQHSDAEPHVPHGGNGAVYRQQQWRTVYPLQVTLDNVSFPGSYPSSDFSPAPTNASLTWGPEMCLRTLLRTTERLWALTNTVTNNITVTSLFPPHVQLYLHRAGTDRSHGPAADHHLEGQNATAVVILTPAVGGAAYPTGTVTLTDALTSNTTTVTLTGTTDTISIPLGILSVGTHTFTATYSGDSNYTLTGGQTVYSTTGRMSSPSTPAALAARRRRCRVCPAQARSARRSPRRPLSRAAVPTGTVQFLVSGGGASWQLCLCHRAP
jgi:hypothetical protein